MQQTKKQNLSKLKAWLETECAAVPCIHPLPTFPFEVSTLSLSSLSISGFFIFIYF